MEDKNTYKKEVRLMHDYDETDVWDNWERGPMLLEVLRPKNASAVVLQDDGYYYNALGDKLLKEDIANYKVVLSGDLENKSTPITLKYLFTGEMKDDENANFYLYAQRFNTKTNKAKWELVYAYDFCMWDYFIMSSVKSGITTVPVDCLKATRLSLPLNREIELKLGFLTEMKFGKMLTKIFYSSELEYNQKKITEYPHLVDTELVSYTLENKTLNTSNPNLLMSIIWLLKQLGDKNSRSLETFYELGFDGFLATMFKGPRKPDWNRFISDKTYIEDLINIDVYELEKLVGIDSFRENPDIVLQVEKAYKEGRYDILKVLKKYDNGIKITDSSCGDRLLHILHILNECPNYKLQELLDTHIPGLR